MTPTEIEQHTTDFLLWGFRLLLVASAIGVLMFVFNSIASATECQGEAGHGYWQWRYIKPHDNKKCWYPGRTTLPKEQLHWPEHRDVIKVKTVRPDEYNELDAQADTDAFFEAKPLTLWPTIMLLVPFIPWQERIAGALP